MYYLQHRWRLEGRTLVYYGMRKKPYLFKNLIRLDSKRANIVTNLPKELDAHDLKILNNLLSEGVIVTEENLRHMPKTIEDARFCVRCAANDHSIPGLEFDEDGLCPMCATEAETRHLESVLPVVDRFRTYPNRRFDVALFYTGGKDSTFLLNHLANHLNLRVLALTWEIPFMSKSARMSIEAAKMRFSNVEFVNRKLLGSDLDAIYKTLFDLQGNTCACPSVAYAIFYPLMEAENVPLFVLGNEPVQMKNLYYNHLAPAYAFNPKLHRLMNAGLNVLRVLTLRKPLRQGQFEALLSMRELAGGRNILKRMSGYGNRMVENVKTALKAAPNLMGPFKKAIRRSSRTGRVPAFVHVDFDRIAPGGRYVWDDVKDMIREQAGWVPPEATGKGLHTSCDIEACKEHTQYMNFLEMRTTMIPFSAIEIALASAGRTMDRDDAIEETKKHLGLSKDDRSGCLLMDRFMEKINGEDGR
jgi:hypothetical protein